MDYNQFWTIEILKKVEIIENQLYFAVLKETSMKKLKSTMDTFYFSVDDEFVYQNYYCDFGPLHISCLFKYCYKLKKYLEYAKGTKRVVHCTSNIPEKKANSAFLIGAFSIIYCNMHPDHIYNLMAYQAGPFKPFVDAAQCANTYNIKLMDCYNAISKALAYNFFDFEDFNSAEYDTYSKLQYGDMNWLVPRKFVAFIGPTENDYINSHPPKFYLKYFIKNDVKTVIRLNNPTYNPDTFLKAGIGHIDLIFPDGTTPPKDVLLKFLQIAENAPAAIAVHCKAGLGRTGSLIGAYIVKHYHLTAKEAIAWMRICRPGSVIGQQQGWLEKIEPWLWKTGTQYRELLYGEGDKIPRHKYGIYSKKWPLERDKLLKEMRKKMQNSISSKHGGESIKRKQKASVDGLNPPLNKSSKSIRNLINDKSPTFKTISKLLSSVHGLDKNYTTGSLNNVSFKSDMSAKNFKIHQTVQRTESNISSNTDIQSLITPNNRNMIKNAKMRINNMKTRIGFNNCPGNSLMQANGNNPGPSSSKNRSQGDKLLEIKARYTNFLDAKKPRF